MRSAQLLLLILAASAALPACSKAPPRAKNVILVSIDTLRRDHLGLYGYARNTSPFLDRIGRAGVAFDQCISQAPWTAPSHASMLSSLYPSVLGMGRFEDPGHIGDSVDMLAEVLADAGFRTHAVTSGGFMAAKIGFTQGFEIYDDAGLNMETTIARAEQWLRGIRRDERFFLFLHTYDVHKYKPPSSYLATWVEPYNGALAYHDRVADLVQNHEEQARAGALDDADRRYIRDLYDASIAATDDWLRRFWENLEERGLAEDTLLVVTADHGEEFWEHGGSGHGYTLYDENLRVPLILHHPSLAARMVPEQVRLLDVAPTIASLVGVERPTSWQGEALDEFMTGHPRVLVAFSEHAHRPAKSARTPNAKLILASNEPTRQFFDLRNDPIELTNLMPSVERSTLRPMTDGIERWLRANAADPRFRSGKAIVFNAAEMEQLAALGYVGGSASGEDEDPELDVWLQILSDAR
jgi:arylsulfatase A-like enzyme